MNWDAIGSIGEIIGAFGVIATLFYVAYQVRQNTNSTQAQTRTQLTSQDLDAIKYVMNDPELAEIMQKVRDNDEATLTASEEMKWHLWIRHEFRLLENILYQYRVGNFSESEFEGPKGRFKSRFAGPDYRKQWADSKSDFSLEFQSEIDALYAEITTD